MLNRFRDLIKRLELPQEDEESLVYRIIDNNNNAVEVTAAQYGLWRMQNDVAKRAIVGQDTVEDVVVRTTFSIMPENRGYQPFGTSAYALPSYDPLVEFSQRYDTWKEADHGHAATLRRVRQRIAEMRAEEGQKSAGVAATALHALSEDMPALFDCTEGREGETLVETPLLTSSGSRVQVSVTQVDDSYLLTCRPVRETPAGSVDTELVLRVLGATVEGDTISCRVDDTEAVAGAIISLAQSAACLSFMETQTDNC